MSPYNGKAVAEQITRAPVYTGTPYSYLKSEAKTTYSPFRDAAFLRLKIISIFLLSFGIGLLSWLAWPFLEWRIIYAPQFTETEIKRPIPAFNSEVQASKVKGEATNFLDVRNWLPQEVSQATSSISAQQYTLSIPKL